MGSIGSIKKCKVHDLLRDLCLREAQKEGFYTVCLGHEIGYVISRVITSRTMHEITEIDVMPSSVPRARSLILNDKYKEVPPQLFKMLRIVCSSITSAKFEENVHQLVNLRFFKVFFKVSELSSFNELPISIWLLWNLQTLIVNSASVFAVSNVIWHMSHIRHLFINNLYLPDPPPNVQANDIVLANLQSLGWIKDFTCSEQMVKSIPNIRKLQIFYEESVIDDRSCLTNLVYLEKLESLNCVFLQSMCLINFPQSLKRLTLDIRASIYCQDILDKIGALPLLEKLVLNKFWPLEGRWETTEGQFRSLKFLALKGWKGMQVWKSEASHFPRLEQLLLYGAHDLEEIPLDFAEISTLRLIDIDRCNVSVAESAKRILEEQETIYGEEETTLQIQVYSNGDDYDALKGFESPNFQILSCTIL